MENSKPVIDTQYLLHYFKIFASSFILPIWVATGVNYFAFTLKFFELYNRDILFWNDKIMTTLFVAVFLIPIFYGVWFYYLTGQKILRQLNRDVFLPLMREFSNQIAQTLIASTATPGGKPDFQKVIEWVNNKISQLPSMLSRLARNLIKKIPLLEVAAAYDPEDLREKRVSNIADSINDRFKELTISAIDEMVPGYYKFLIPINLLLLFALYKI